MEYDYCDTTNANIHRNSTDTRVAMVTLLELSLLLLQQNGG